MHILSGEIQSRRMLTPAECWVDPLKRNFSMFPVAISLMFDCHMWHFNAFTMPNFMPCLEMSNSLFNDRGIAFLVWISGVACLIHVVSHSLIRIAWIFTLKQVCLLFFKQMWFRLNWRIFVNCLVRESSECPTHLTVMYKYRFYRLETYHQGKQLNITEFYKQLEKIVAIGDSKAFGVGIGALTADNRDSWAQVRILI